MDCYLINLDRSPDRFSWIKSQADARGLSLRRVSAVDGKELGDQELARWHAVESGHFGMGPGEIGCFLSHRLAWQMILSDQAPWAFVAEDDIHFSANAQLFLKTSDWIPADADLVKAETARQRVWLSTRPTTASFGHLLHRLQSAHGGSAGYFISRSAASRLIEATEHLCSIPDQVLFNPLLGIASRLTTYQLDPAICIQDWCLAGAAEQGLGSLLLSEREQFHGSKLAHRKRGAARIWYKLSNPVKKASRAGLMLTANALGTHIVKKVPFPIPAH